jgi:ketosteroid isomerase-like protein
MIAAPFLALALVLAQAGAARADDPAEVLRAADRAFFQDTRKNGLEGWLGWFAEDAVVVPPSGPLAVGSEAIRKHYEGQRGFPYKGFVWQPDTASISSLGDFGWTIGSWGSDATGEAVWNGKYLTVWRKGPDGTWKVVVDCPYDPGYDKRLPGLSGAPRSCTRESERVFLSASGELEASVGSWYALDADQGECGGKFVEVWRRQTDQALKLVVDTGLLQPRP